MATIKVDFEKCLGNGVCESVAPNHFELDDDGFLQVLKEDVSDDETATVQNAVDGCPTEALRLEQ